MPWFGMRSRADRQTDNRQTSYAAANSWVLSASLERAQARSRKGFELCSAVAQSLETDRVDDVLCGAPKVIAVGISPPCSSGVDHPLSTDATHLIG